MKSCPLLLLNIHTFLMFEDVKEKKNTTHTQKKKVNYPRKIIPTVLMYIRKIKQNKIYAIPSQKPIEAIKLIDTKFRGFERM